MPAVETDGIATYYERRGEGPPVVFVHAAILDHSQWDPQAEALSGDYETVAYDVRGHGQTGGSAREAYSIGLFAEDLLALLDALDLERPVVCGASTGGCTAQVLAARHPDRVRGLVLVDSFAPVLHSRSEWLQRSLLLRAAIPPARLLGYQRVERALVWLHERRSRGAAGDYGNVADLRRNAPPMATAEFAKVIRAVATFHRTALDLGAIVAPTLVLYGERVPPFLLRHARYFAETIPDVTVRPVPGAGHASNLDDPAFVTGAIREFVAGLGTGAQPSDVGGER